MEYQDYINWRDWFNYDYKNSDHQIFLNIFEDEMNRKINAKNYSSIFLAVKQCKIAILEKILILKKNNKIDIDFVNLSENGWTILELAIEYSCYDCNNKRIDIIDLLINNNADYSKNNNRAIQIAKIYNNKKIIDLLIKAKVNLNIDVNLKIKKDGKIFKGFSFFEMAEIYFQKNLLENK